MTSPPRTTTYARGATGLALWVLAIVVATAVAWWAVAFVGGSRAGAAGDVLSQHQVVDTLDQHRTAATSSPTPGTPTATPSPIPSPIPSSTPEVTSGPTPTTPAVTPPPTGPATPPPALDVVRVWEVDGGQVSASCRGTSIGLIYATASDGWTVETRSAGPEEIEIKLSRNESETAVRARCVAGVPTLTATEDESHGGGDDG